MNELMIVVDTFHIAMAFTHDIDMRIVPGKSLGDFSLGDSLWNVLERMRARKLESGIRRDDGAVGSGSECFSSSSAGLGLMCCAKDPTSPVIVDVPPGIKLVFPYTPAPHQQILQIITVHLRHNDVRPSQPSRLQTLNISYENKHLATIGSQHESKTPLTRGKISQIFGPAFTRRPGTPSAKPSADRSSPSREPDIRYPGIVFSTDQLHGDVIGDVAVVAAGQEESAEMRRFVDQLRGATTEQGWPTLEWIDRQALVGTITLCEIIVSLSYIPVSQGSLVLSICSHIKASSCTSPTENQATNQPAHTASTWEKQRNKTCCVILDHQLGDIGKRRIGS